MTKNFLTGILLCCISVQVATQNLSQELDIVFSDFELMGMSVWLSVDNKETEYHFGLRDFDRSLLITPQTHYRIASVSKAFTALGILKLYDQGAFEMDDAISPYLGYMVENPSHPGLPITFRMLLSHTSSLQDGSGYAPFLAATYSQDPIPSIAEVLIPGGVYFSSNMWRSESPGTFFAYSNLNYGVLGTLIEKISGVRFDTFMKNEILVPLGISGSFNIQDLPDINDVAVLYRNQGGWQPQYDNYQGNMPPPPNLGSYVPGTNGVYFAPQGGLRISASDTGKFLRYLATNGGASNLQISEDTLILMKSLQWDYNGTNGDMYSGLFNRWGLGLHHANITPNDAICEFGNFSSFLGHPGEAYGLISDAYFLEEYNVSFSLLINGSWNGYQAGAVSSFYTVEEAVFSALCDHINEQLFITDLLTDTLSVYPNPASETLTLELSNFQQVEKITITNALGHPVQVPYSTHTTGRVYDISTLASGIYFLSFMNHETFITKKILIE
ncbi:serine hydrolase [Altibacter sp.]|uniref:serine hydrolase n=1 Tax=Altibacter sp. TaxID=2024823 RepID=UPI0025C62770|nr:serine hydrolase [Altibacter sp.]